MNTTNNNITALTEETLDNVQGGLFFSIAVTGIVIAQAALAGVGIAVMCSKK